MDVENSVSEMENVDPPRPQWIYPEPTLGFLFYFLIAVLLIKAHIGPLLSDSHQTAFHLVVRSLVVFGLAFWVFGVSRGRIHVIARWLMVTSACLALATVAYMVLYV